ncbi:MAG: leucine-rich repeat domain-containing protein [Lachnospiraceae bacterium]|nr:leucine-rich repeat domain-containing protein [Lachnospiraceae bacterium]
MGRKIRRLIALLLCITSVMIMCMPPQQPYASVQKGDFEIDGSTLVKYTGHDDILTLPNTIQTIGKEAFSGNKSLVKVIMPESVRTIDFSAFENCTSLIQAVLPESVRAIGSSAFSGCEQLKYVNITSRCEQIGSGAFAGCPKLSTITVATHNPSYICVDGILYSKDGTRVVQYLAGRTKSSYNMPSTVEAIDEYAFWGAGGLTDISISSAIKEIPEYAFANCSGLKNVVLPYRVESLMAYSFSDCYSLANVTMPDSLGYIDEKAFYLTDGVTVNYYDADDAKRKIEEEDVPEELFSQYIDTVSSNSYDPSDAGSAREKKYINDMPYVSSMTPDYSDSRIPGELASSKIVGGKAVLMIDRSIPVHGYDPAASEVEDSVPDTVPVSDKVYMEGNYRTVGGTVTGGESLSGNCAMPEGITRIGNRAFYRNRDMTGAALPQGLEGIGDFAFARTGLTDISIPHGVKEIGYAAFYNCGNLTDISIPDSVETIELGAFDGTPWLERMMGTGSNDGFVIEGDGILVAYAGEGGQVNVPESVKVIGPGSFADNTGLTGITLPDGLVKIGEEAFRGCKNLKDIAIPDGVKSIEDRAFKDTGIGGVAIPASVESIGLGAFDTGNKGNTIRFLGEKIPVVSYKKTATRLSADDLRSAPLKGFDTAVITNEARPSYFSVLSPDKRYEGKVFRENGEEVVEEPDEGEPIEGTTEKFGNTLVFMDSSISPDKELPVANMSGVDGGYHIKISDASDKEDISNTALEARYGGLEGIEAVPLNITLYEDESDIPITKLSGKNVDIELPIPTGLTLAPSISVGAIDDNGELKEISSEIVNNGGNDKIRFIARHFSVYVFYTIQEETEVLTMENEEALAANTQSVVVRTLNRDVGTIALKWYIGIGLLIIAGILAFYKGKPRTLAN